MILRFGAFLHLDLDLRIKLLKKIFIKLLKIFLNIIIYIKTMTPRHKLINT